MKGMRIALFAVSVAWIAVLALLLFVVPEGSRLEDDLPTLLLFILPLASALLCYIHATALKLSAGSWAFAGLLFPFASPWLLALRSPAPDIEKMKKENDVDGLVQALFDRRYELAGDAYVALYKLDDPRKVPALLRALPRASRPSQGGNRVIDVLVGNGSEEAISGLLAALNDRRFRSRAQIAYTLSKAKDPRVAPALLPMLNERDEKVRHAAMSTLGELRCSEALAALLKILRQGSKADHVTAVSALGKLGSREAVEPLLEVLQERRLEMRDAAVKALGLLGDKRAVEPLLELLQKERRQAKGKDRRWYLRHSIAEALGKIGDSRACEPLLALLYDPDSQVCDAAAEAYDMLRGAAKRRGEAVPEIEVVRCAGCRRWLRRSPLDALEVLVKSAPDISRTQVYPCKACGALFCIDCMARAIVLRDGRQCPKCFQSSGW